MLLTRKTCFLIHSFVHYHPPAPCFFDTGDSVGIMEGASLGELSVKGGDACKREGVQLE